MLHILSFSSSFLVLLLRSFTNIGLPRDSIEDDWIIKIIELMDLGLFGISMIFETETPLLKSELIHHYLILLVQASPITNYFTKFWK